MAHGHVDPHFANGHAGFVRAIFLLVLVALFAIDIGGTVLIVRGYRRLTRVGTILVWVAAVWTGFGAVVAFVQDLDPGNDWWGALVSSAFIVAYGVVACGVVFLLDAGARRLLRPRSLRA